MKRFEILGKRLNKEEQRKINGGYEGEKCQDKCQTNADCNPNGGHTFECVCNTMSGCNPNNEYKQCEVIIQ